MHQLYTSYHIPFVVNTQFLWETKHHLSVGGKPHSNCGQIKALLFNAVFAIRSMILVSQTMIFVR